MVDHEDQIGFIVVTIVLIALVLGIRKYLQYKKRLFKMTLQERHHEAVTALTTIIVVLAVTVYSYRTLKSLEEKVGQIVKPTTANQQEDIFNISGRVPGQAHQWPTHDGHVSLDHFSIANEVNKYNDSPPTYEEAMHLASSTNNNNTVVPAVVPKTSTATITTTNST